MRNYLFTQIKFLIKQFTQNLIYSVASYTVFIAIISYFSLLRLQ